MAIYNMITYGGGSGGGGGTKSKPRKDVNFFDYDGTIVESYTTQEWSSVTSLPTNPSHERLVAQGWNYTLAEINTMVSAQGKCDVGQMYVTESGDTEIDIHIADIARNNPYLGFAVNGTAVIDWGDGSATDTVTGTSLTSQIRTQHTYSAVGDYTIQITVSSGDMALFSTSAYLLLSNNSERINSCVFSNMVRAVRIGANTSIGDSAFYYCYSLASITIPSGITSISSSAFDGCCSLASVTIPSGITSISNNMFNNLFSLASVTIPSGITSIGSSAFNGCYSLASVIIPSGVTSIGKNAFNSCYGVKIYHIKPTTPPTLASANAFANMPSDCVMYVPSASLSAYQSATNWSTYASKMVGE